VGDTVAVPSPPLQPPGLFDFEQVWVCDGDAVILRDVDVTVPEGGITVIRGPSGSGKSTLLRLCNRLEIPSRGRVLLRGRDLATLDPVALRRRVGMVFQTPTPFPGTVLDNLRVAADMDPPAAARLLERVGLPAELLDRDAATLSGGEAQRMCLARTLATGCEVLLADESTSSLDPAAARVLEELVAQLAAAGTTVLWVTHDEAQCERIATHTLFLDHGRVVGGSLAR